MFRLELSSRSWIRLILSAILTFSLGVASSAMASDVRFTSGGSALKIPFQLYNNHIYLRVAVNGSAPLWFVLDTGAGNIIASKHARALGLKLTPAGQAAGSGEKPQDVFITENVSFALPGVTVTRQKSAVLDFESLEECSNELDIDAQGNMMKRQQSRKGDERQPFDGVLGEELFRLFVVEIDYAAQVMNLYEPKDYKYNGQGEAIPLEVRSRYVFVRTQLASSKRGNVPGLFMIDTGNMGALVLHRPFVEKNGLLPPDNESTPFEVCGIGGSSMSRMGKLESLRLGSLDVKSPVTLFSQAKDGNLISSDYDGLIGNAVLRHFKVVFDYSRSRMILEAPRKVGVEQGVQPGGQADQEGTMENTSRSQIVHRWYTRPVFFVTDVNRAARFYVEMLGFEKGWHEADGAGTVCQVNHGECEIILCEDATRRDRARLFIELTSEGLADLRRELVERSVPTKETYWGYETLQVDDPDGNELFFPRPD